MRIGLDLDGVLADFDGSFRPFLIETLGLTCDVTDYDFGLNKQKFAEAHDLFIAIRGFVHLAPYKGVKEWVQRIHALGNQITYITRRRACGTRPEIGYNIECQTQEWLFGQDFPTPQNLIFTDSKAVACVQRDIEVLVEDWKDEAERVNGLRTINGKHIRCYLVDRPWNQGDYPRRVCTLNEISEWFN